MSEDLKVLFIISEAEPLLKVGGLGDVGGTLPIALKALPKEKTDQRNIDVRIVLPYHDVLKQRNEPVEWLFNYQIPCGSGFQDVYVSRSLRSDIPIYLIDGDPVRNRGTYNPDGWKDSEKYTFFSVAGLELCKQLDWQPDILHAHDWHAACSVMKLKQLRAFNPFFEHTRSLYTIHNLPYTGGYFPDIFERYDIKPSFDPDIPADKRSVPMTLGLSAADKISTVSETYAQEIQTPAFGHGYETFLRRHSDKVCGIVNGLLPEQWDPLLDKVLYENYGPDSIEKRIVNRRMLQKEVGLPERDDVPLFVMIGRLDYQKGNDLCTQAFRRLRDRDWQLIILGSGNPGIEQDCRNLAAEFPDRVRAEIRYDGPFSRKMYAGGDMLLMPSRYEPCGIAQMIAMRYGCIPIAHATGGLKDTVIDEDANRTGFLFSDDNIASAEGAVRRALDMFPDKEAWLNMQKRGMEQSFSWEISAEKYYHLYTSLLKG